MTYGHFHRRPLANASAGESRNGVYPNWVKHLGDLILKTRLERPLEDDSRQVLEEFLTDIRSMKLHPSRTLGAALKKPLMLLLLLSRFENNKVEENRFYYGDIEKKLALLISRHGGRRVRSGPRPEQPFSHLRSSPFWTLKTQRDYEPGTTALISDLRNVESYGSLKPSVYRLLSSSSNARASVVDAILHQWWSETLHGDIREDLGLDRLDSRRQRHRNRQFTIDVLENYRYSCAFCGFHAVLNGQATGIDAAHVQWHAHRGPDEVSNGIALCKLHHWAFDKGILGIDQDYRIRIADAFVAQSDGGLPMEALTNHPLAVSPHNTAVSDIYLDWHRQNVYLGM